MPTTMGHELMKIIRCLTTDGSTTHAVQTSEESFLAIDGDLFGDHRVSDRAISVDRVLAPLVPTQIIGIGLNYRQHAKEAGMPEPGHPVVFHKSVSSLQGPEAPIVLPKGRDLQKVDYECELAVVIGRDGKDIPPERALDHVLGFSCANDVSARDWQLEHGGGQWCYGKSFDTFCPIGPAIVTPDALPNANALRISTLVNGALVQDSSTGDMIFDVPSLIAYLSAGTTLLAGSVILTGTPHGVAMGRPGQPWLKAGDEVIVRIEGIGDLRNPVVDEA